jgi:hypothetical protein
LRHIVNPDPRLRQWAVNEGNSCSLTMPVGERFTRESELRRREPHFSSKSSSFGAECAGP